MANANITSTMSTSATKISTPMTRISPKTRRTTTGQMKKKIMSLQCTNKRHSRATTKETRGRKKMMKKPTKSMSFRPPKPASKS